MEWPGCVVPDCIQSEVQEACRKDNTEPVFLPTELVDGFYNGFYNNVLWPLFHYIPPPLNFLRNDSVDFSFQAYAKANQIFT